LKDGYPYLNDDNDATIAQFNTGTANGRSRKKSFIKLFLFVLHVYWIFLKVIGTELQMMR
jgi:hypothetical protein